ncbi:FAD-dependent oxidoreductase [Enterocloster asparagiformis]|uniref:FAD binding domain in molybdopterin dehydrogenase n=2 Tax=Enterocloster asparagiformis TaxID=333367 RepID=C0D021_9FIRM|nr:FAD-dependent oxidoreductase [Enterocloster asparagiformis]EEG55383.1 FAD binding domain in molybdopterin dehydrogenase [[Clostridium] asparagiforme DSM 15981]RGX26609.1 FAD-binding protein [Enterocloster asparagiformis]UWO74872.1 FAD-dependent oxidoreductase [[Clostridium] asparagiforme DSM 15981]
MKNFTYKNPASVEEAVSFLMEPGTVAMGGGTDLLGVLKDGLLPEYPGQVVNLKNIPGLNRIEEQEDGLHIGAAATLRDVADSPVVGSRWPALQTAAKSVATPNLRNTATVAGNICQDIRCWYYRYPDILGGKINCARKSGHLCSAMMGENRYHSIFGAAKVCETPCTGKCPAHTDISAYMEMVRAGEYESAARVLLEVNPMPAITSRVCAHFCMEGCNRNTYDESLNVGSIERFLGDYILEHADQFLTKPERENGKHISIVGSGPAGLTAACYLRQSGYRVTVYEKQKEAGGCLSYAIPAYRLPKEIVRRFVGALEHMGVAFRCGCAVGTDIQLEEIYQDSDGVMLDTGTWKRPLIGLAGEELTRFGLEFLVDVNNYILEKPGSDVVVVGGGNVAMDVAITAKRLGAPNVTMVCLEQRDGMPANEEEVTRALEEGVVIQNGWGPKEVLRRDGAVSGIVFKSCPRVLDETGRFNPVYDEDKLLTLDADIILMAIGQKADLEFLNGAYEVETERGRIKALEGNRTSVDGIFAGGDVTTGPATVIKAIAAGKETAVAINRHCGLEPLEVEKAQEAREATKLASFDPGCRHSRSAVKSPLLPVEERGMDKEDMGDLPEEAVRGEACRCFNCGCLAVNPSDMANMLYAYGARVRTSLRELDGAVFFAGSTRVKDILKPGEIVLEIVVPGPEPGTVAVYDKYRVRKSIDFAVLAVAGTYRLEDGLVKEISLVLGAVAPIPMKMTEAENYLRGKALNEEAAREAAEIALRHAIPLEMNGYKIEMAKVMVRRFLGF